MPSRRTIRVRRGPARRPSPATLSTYSGSNGSSARVSGASRKRGDNKIDKGNQLGRLGIARHEQQDHGAAWRDIVGEDRPQRPRRERLRNDGPRLENDAELRDRGCNQRTAIVHLQTRPDRYGMDRARAPEPPFGIGPPRPVDEAETLVTVEVGGRPRFAWRRGVRCSRGALTRFSNAVTCLPIICEVMPSAVPAAVKSLEVVTRRHALYRCPLGALLHSVEDCLRDPSTSDASRLCRSCRPPNPRPCSIWCRRQRRLALQ